MSLTDAAMAKVKAHIAQRRVRLDDGFADFDRLRTGRLTASQFARVLALNQVSLSQEEVAALAAAFEATSGKTVGGTSSSPSAPAAAAAAGTGQAGAAAAAAILMPSADVDYTAFLAALRKQPLESAENGAGAAAAAALAGSRFNPFSACATGAGVQPSPLSQQEEDMLQPSMQMLRHAIRSRGIDVVSPFRDLDRLNTGLVTVAQFERGLPMFEKLTPEAVKLLGRKYGDGQGNVAYMAWCLDVDEVLRDRSRGGGGDASSATANINSNSDDDRTGRYASAGPEQSYLRSFGVGTYTNATLTAPALVGILREQCALYHLRCDDYLTDFDKHKTGTVSAAQFESALGRLRLVRFALTEENVSTLIAAYAQDAGAGDKEVTVTGGLADSAIRVKYTDFLSDVDPKNVDATMTQLDTRRNGSDSVAAAASASYYATTHATDTFLTDEAEKAEAARVVEKVGRLVRTNRIFLSPVLRDFDRVRKAIYEHRTCTSSRFARALATQNLILPPEELRVLIKKYSLPTVDGSVSDDVNYYQFIQDVDPSQANTVARQGSSLGGGGGGGAGAGRVPGRASAAVVEERPATPLDIILQKIAAQCNERELRVGEFFHDFDPLRSGTLLPSHFISALAIAGITEVSEEELATLVQAFPSPKAKGSVDAHAFLREMGTYAPLSVPSATMTGTTLTGRCGGRAATAGGAGGGADGEGMTSVGPAGATTANSAFVSSLCAEEQARLAPLLRRLRHDVAAHNALLTPFFADFDRFRRGKITQQNFRRALARHSFTLDEADTALLCKAYAAPAPGNADPAGESVIEYRRFIRDVGDEDLVDTAPTIGDGRSSANANGTRSTESAAAAPVVTVEEALAHVCCYLQERRPRLREFFPDGDELRHGRVTRARFRHCLNILGLRLSEAELQALEEGFPASSSVSAPPSSSTPKELLEVDYPGFIATVQELLAAGLGASAVHERRCGETTALYESMKRRPETGEGVDSEEGQQQQQQQALTATQAESLLTATLARIRRGLATRRTTTRPALRQYDRTRRGFVKEGQFFACLIAVLGVPLTPLESSVLTKAFSLGNGEMGYIHFCDEVDSEEFTSVS